MFTGIIQAKGKLQASELKGGDKRCHIDCGKLDMSDVQVGDSIAVNGVCLTAVEVLTRGFVADVSLETLARTTLEELQPGAPVNLEKALTPDTRLGGHFVSGHVDGIGTVLSREDAARSVSIVIEAPAQLAKYIAEKGSICVDGTSLTVNQVKGAQFVLNIVPHTLTQTITGDYQSGARVNLEVDIIARYLERLLLGEKAAATGGISREILQERGFIRE